MQEFIEYFYLFSIIINSVFLSFPFYKSMDSDGFILHIFGLLGFIFLTSLFAALLAAAIWPLGYFLGEIGVNESFSLALSVPILFFITFHLYKLVKNGIKSFGTKS